MLKPLLIEIGVEELPAIPFLREFKNFDSKWESILEEYQLISSFEIFYSPRRVVIFHKEFPIKEPDRVEELFGAPVEIAIKDREPTKAGVGFAKKCGVDFSELKRAKKGSKEVLYFKKEIAGRDSKELIPEILDKFLNSLSFGKSMRWIDRDTQFIRPIRWIGVMLDREPIKFKSFGVESNSVTFGHRQVNYEPIEYKSEREFFQKLKDSGVILYQDEREKKILQEFDKLEQENRIKIERDSELLREVVAITEYPTALIGEFDSQFLELPDEVIITSMKEHQRYFAVYSEDGSLTNRFIVISNAKVSNFEKIIAGNEKVLRARLSDGLFFYRNDLKNGFNIEGLKSLIFTQELGTLYDKIERERRVAIALFDKYWSQIDGTKEELERAVELSKADLLTEVVYEFTELQGLMGYYYAKEFKESENICQAIKEQYLPTGESSELPTSNFSAVVALSNKLDNILALFSVGSIPTGSRDPFALRRSANGVIRIILDRELNFDISHFLEKLTPNYREFDVAKVEEFLLERLYQTFQSVNPSIVKSVIQSGDRDILNLSKKIEALNQISKSEDFREIVSTFKRVANIVEDIDIDRELTVDRELFESEFEFKLLDKFNSILDREYLEYESRLDGLFSIKPELDNFFDNVMVNAKDENVKLNRKSLIGKIYQAFRDIADIKEITL